MRTVRQSVSVLILFAVVLSACSQSESETVEPTMSSEDVLRTAEAIAAKTKSASPPTSSPTPIAPTATPPIETATPEPTATPSSPKVTANYNANVRAGPDESYEVIDIFFQGQEADVIGLYQHPTMGIWWFIRRIGEGLNGWVWNGAVTLSGDASGVPAYELPPTSTPAPEPTSPPEPTETPTATETT
ncbi:MAG: hypothetical protein GTO18_02200 [Anaerolineales bacterium]|nr:hypothetical protein [Anaerolineales bacterium]